jgi:hypothetical protein
VIEESRETQERRQQYEVLKRSKTRRRNVFAMHFLLLFLASAAVMALLILGILSGPIGWLALGGMLGLALIGTTLTAITGPVRTTPFAVILGITSVAVGASCIAASVFVFLANPFGWAIIATAAAFLSGPLGWIAIAAAVAVTAIVMAATAYNYSQRFREQYKEIEDLLPSGLSGVDKPLMDRSDSDETPEPSVLNRTGNLVTNTSRLSVGHTDQATQTNPDDLPVIETILTGVTTTSSPSQAPQSPTSFFATPQRLPSSVPVVLPDVVTPSTLSFGADTPTVSPDAAVQIRRSDRPLSPPQPNEVIIVDMSNSPQSSNNDERDNQCNTIITSPS